MKRIFSIVLAFCVTIFPANAEIVEQLQTSLSIRIPEVRSNCVMVTRVGVLDVHAAALLDAQGQILAPQIEPIDETPVPYLILHPDGRREELEIVAEYEKRSLVLLRLPGELPQRAVLTRFADLALGDRGVLAPLPSPAPSLGELIAVPLIPQAKPTDDEDDEDITAGTLSVDTTALVPGGLVFDLGGRLCGVAMPAKAESTVIVSLPKIAEAWPELETIIADRTEGIGRVFALPEQTHTTSVFENKLPEPAPFGLVLNRGKSLSFSVMGTVVREDGLIVTKASELGPDLSFRIGDKTLPAALIATDDKTDLALVAVAAQGLPVVEWADGIRVMPTDLLISPSILTPQGNGDGGVRVGTFSHRLGADPIPLAASSQVTSLELVTEQAKTNLVVAALRPGGAASKAGVEVGDEVFQLDEAAVPDRATLAKVLAGHQVGDEVVLSIRRGEDEMEVELKLGPARPLPSVTGIRFEGRILPSMPSIYRGPFPVGCFVHDLPIDAWDCGSPVFDRKGRAVGLNIAAAAPYRGLALPPSVVRAAVDRMLLQNRSF